MDHVATHRDLLGACVWRVRWATSVAVTENTLGLEQAGGGGWQLTGQGAAGFGLVNDYLGYLADRNYSPRTVRAYGFDLLAFVPVAGRAGPRPGRGDNRCAAAVSACCREATVPGRPAGNVVSMSGRPLDRVCGDDDQPSAGGDLRVVRVSADAGSGRAESGAAGSGGAVGDRG